MNYLKNLKSRIKKLILSIRNWFYRYVFRRGLEYKNPEFMKELDRMGIKKIFLDNMYEQRGDIRDAFKSLDRESWESFIGGFCNWRETPQGYDFWRGVSRKDL